MKNNKENFIIIYNETSIIFILYRTSIINYE